MNWIEKFNRLEKIYIDEILDILIDFAEFKEERFSETYVEACDLLYKTNSNEIADIKERIDRNEKKWREIIECLPNIRQELESQFKSVEKLLKEREIEFIRESGKYINRKEVTLYMKRCFILRNKVGMMIKSIQDNYAEELADVLIQILYETGKLISEDDKEKFEEIIEENRMIDYRKIFNYKEMEKLALDYGYKKVRQNGDHMMYKHTKTNKLVPIVTHDFGIGLSIRVQKQLYKNSLAA